MITGWKVSKLQQLRNDVFRFVMNVVVSLQ
jgi:hypothetical protein